MPETLDELCEMARSAVKDLLWSHGGSIRQADGSYHIDTKEAATTSTPRK